MSKKPILFFNMIETPTLFLSDSSRSFFHAAHIFLGWFLIALLSLHIFAAFYHRFYKKDAVWQAMSFKIK